MKRNSRVYSNADFLYSVRVSDCNRPSRKLFQSINLPTSVSVGCTSGIFCYISCAVKR